LRPREKAASERGGRTWAKAATWTTAEIVWPRCARITGSGSKRGGSVFQDLHFGGLSSSALCSFLRSEAAEEGGDDDRVDLIWVEAGALAIGLRLQAMMLLVARLEGG